MHLIKFWLWFGASFNGPKAQPIRWDEPVTCRECLDRCDRAQSEFRRVCNSIPDRAERRRCIVNLPNARLACRATCRMEGEPCYVTAN